MQSGYYIQSFKRRGDGAIFSVGSKIIFSAGPDSFESEIKSIEASGSGNLMVTFKNNISVFSKEHLDAIKHKGL